MCNSPVHAPPHTHENEQHHAHEHTHRHESGHQHAHEHGIHTETPCETPPAGIILTVRATSGLSGDIMLAGLAALAGLDSAALNTLAGELRLSALYDCLELVERQVNGITGLGLNIRLPKEHAHRSLKDVNRIVDAGAMPDKAKERAKRAFTLLAEAEAHVHGLPVQEVTFHEVGALDSILDICLVSRIHTMLAPARFVCSPLPLADGSIHCAHGIIPSPAPAVLRMLEGVPVCGFSGQGETVTPTALCLLKALDAEFGGWPSMKVEKSVISYGTKIFPSAPNGVIWALGAG